MKRFIKFPSIPQLPALAKEIAHQTQFIGVDEDGVAQYDRQIKLPVVQANITEKVHGTNAAFCYSKPDGFWVQSRNAIITPENDNAGCAQNIYENTYENWLRAVRSLAGYGNIDLETHVICIFFEWAGGNIQKHSALSGLSKKAVIFEHFAVAPLVEGEELAWGSFFARPTWTSKIINLASNDIRKAIIDFNNLDAAYTELESMVAEIEDNSPLGERYGVHGNTGEGIVGTFWLDGVLKRFKLKGTKHEKKLPVALSEEQAEDKKKAIVLAQQVTPIWRLEQMYQETFDTINGGYGDIKGLGQFLKAVNQDIAKEEMSLIIESGLDIKTIHKPVAFFAKEWFLLKLKE